MSSLSLSCSSSNISPYDPWEISIYLNQFKDPPLIFGDVTPLLKPHLHPTTPVASTNDEIWFWDSASGGSQNLTEWAVFMLYGTIPIIVDLEMHCKMFWSQEIDEHMIIPLMDDCKIVNISFYQKKHWLTKILKKRIRNTTH
jgi:hypothetical protein